MTPSPDLAAPRPIRLGVALLVGGLHLLAVVGLIRAFAPDLAERAAEAVVATFAVEAPPPPDPPPPRSTAPAGRAAPPARRATPRPEAVPSPRIALPPPVPAPVAAATGAAATGAAERGGAHDQGEANGGGGGTGAGTGRGTGGTGSGAGSPLIKIAGEINSARDYPAASRDLRLGDRVIIALTVGPDGHPTACRIVRPSRDAAADAITCRLAQARFRFRPATDAAGQPVAATFGWQQRWFRPGEE